MMSSSHDSAPVHLRVNGSMLYDYKGKHVSLLGKSSKVGSFKTLSDIYRYSSLISILMQVMSDQMSFELISSDGKCVLVKLKMALKEELTPFVEVYGVVDERGHINCVDYATFDDSITNNFGMAKHKLHFFKMRFIYLFFHFVLYCRHGHV